MYKVELKELGKDKAEICEIIKTLSYKELIKVVSPYVKEEHLSFSVPNYDLSGSHWGYIFSGEKHVGQIKITDLMDV